MADFKILFVVCSFILLIYLFYEIEVICVLSCIL